MFAGYKALGQVSSHHLQRSTHFMATLGFSQNIKTGKRVFESRGHGAYEKIRRYNALYHISVLSQNSSDFRKKSTPLLASVLFYLAALFNGKSFTSLSLFPALVCRHYSLSRLLDCFQHGQINSTICKTLGEKVFSRLATSIFHPNAGEQHWILASHSSCSSRRYYKELYFLELLQIIDITLPEWRQPKYGVYICLSHRQKSGTFTA